MSRFFDIFESKNKKHPRKLDFSEMALGNSCLELIATSLLAYDICALDLSNNNFTDYKCLIDAIKNSTSLVHLSLSGN